MPRLVNRQEKMEAILDASLPLFARKGFNGTNVAEIANKAGIGKGTIYEYFESKKDIFYNLIDRWKERTNQSLNQSIEGIEDPEKKLTAIVEWNVEFLNTLDSDISKLFLEMIKQTITKGGVFYDNRAFMDELSSGIRNSIRNVILEGVSEGVFSPSVAKNAEKISLNICAYLDGTAMYYLMNKPSTEELKSLIKMFINGVFRSLRNNTN